jgi:hypothetical protein
MASLRAWIAGGPDRVDSAKAASPAGPLSGSPASFYARAPADAVVWPPTEQAYERIMRGLVPFVFVGRKHPGTGVVSGVVLVNAELREEGLWGKLEVSHVPGRALATVEVAGNVRKFREFPEVDVLAVCLHGVARGGGVLTEEASEAELLAISPAWKVGVAEAFVIFFSSLFSSEVQEAALLAGAGGCDCASDDL